jgi:tyrosinase
MAACRHIGTGLSVNHLYFSNVQNSNGCVDAPNFFESSFWQDFDSSSGLGGWGDPNNDYRVPNGALSNMTLTYPSSHTVRRNFTLQPFQDPNQPLYSNPDMQANSSFSSSAIQAILGTSAGDYPGFQMGIETFEVGAWISGRWTATHPDVT